MEMALLRRGPGVMSTSGLYSEAVPGHLRGQVDVGHGCGHPYLKLARSPGQVTV